MNSLSRRRFLKITGATFGAAAAVTSLNSVVKGADTIEKKTGNKVKGIQKIPTFCDVCFWKCGAVAYVKDGELWKIEGHPEDPLSNGRLCPRGTGGIGAHFDKSRLKAPLIRKGPRGKEEFVQVTWDEALDYIAGKMKKIKKDYGPESMALFSHGIGGAFFKHLMKAYGTPNLTAPSFAQCRGPREVGFELTYGDVIGSPERTDIKNTQCLVLLGSHLGENMHNTQVQEFAEAVEKGATIITVDPRFSVAAGKSKYYLPIKPGTDMALLLAWMNVIVTEKLYNKNFIDKYAFGFEQFEYEIAQYTPEWAYIETTIDPDVIRKTAREMARYAPATIVHPGRHVTWYGDDAQRSRAIALLNALMGNWGKRGGFYNPQNVSIPSYPYPPYPKSKRGAADNPHHKFPFAEGGEKVSTGLRYATLTEDPYPIKGWFVYATNLTQALPNTQETIDAIQKLDLMVVVDVVPSEIAGYADVVLPENVYLERYDELNTPLFRESFVALRQPVVDAPDDQKPNWWMAKKLAERLDLGQFFPWKNIEEYLDTRLKSAGLSLKVLKEKGVIKGPNQSIYNDENNEPEFYTSTGKIEFYSIRLKEAGFDPIPKYNKPEEPPAGYFRLLYGRAPVHTFSKTQSNRYLADMMDENEVWLNADVAKRIGINNGEYIKLKNQDGIVSNKVKAKVTERIRTDCVYMVHGFGQRSKMYRQTFNKGASDSQLITKYKVDPLMGGTGMNVNFVTIEWEA